MKPVDRIRQKVLGLTKKQFQIVKDPHRYYYYEESMFYRNKRIA